VRGERAGDDKWRRNCGNLAKCQLERVLRKVLGIKQRERLRERIFKRRSNTLIERTGVYVINSVPRPSCRVLGEVLMRDLRYG
jgi:hypothetical protein